MSDRITSRTITRITHENAQNPPPGPVPTPEDVLKTIITKMEQIITGERTENGIDKGKAKLLLLQLNKILADPPEGFELATVAYSKIPTDESRAAMDEFGSRVKPQFFKYLATHYADDLREMGICENGIGRMRNGHSPADAEGRLYSVSVDHIIERAGSGRLGQTKSIDPDLEALPDQNGNRETLQVNHMRNLILLPNAVHFDCKNMLNSLQDITMLQQGGLFRWSVMLVPKDNIKSPYAYAPTQAQKHKYGVGFRSKAPQENLRDTLDDLGKAINRFNGTKYGKTLKAMCHEMANTQKTSVAEILREQEKTVANDNLTDGKVPLKIHFHQALFDYGSEEAKTSYCRIVKMTREIKHQVAVCFNAASEIHERTGKTAELCRLRDFFNSNKLKRSREKLAGIPERELGSVNRILRGIDHYHHKTLVLINPEKKPKSKSKPKPKFRHKYKGRRKG